jgi:hypothetical protein
MNEKTRQQAVGTSQSRRISSAKPKKVSQGQKKETYEKLSSKASLKNDDETLTRDLLDF